jgi:adenine phosphoribosyltransferase
VHHITAQTLPSIGDASKRKVDAIVALDARGFLIGPVIALRLGAKFVPVRKAGKLPGKTLSASYEKEYGTVRARPSFSCPVSSVFTHIRPLLSQQDSFQIQEGAIEAGDTVIVIDDLIATGSCLVTFYYYYALQFALTLSL